MCIHSLYRQRLTNITIMTEETLMTEDLDTASPDAEAVKEYLQKYVDEDRVKQEQEEAVENGETSPRIREVNIDDSAFQTTIAADTTFDKAEAEEIVRMYMAPVKDSEVPITDDDQALYLKAMLNDVPLELSQALANGKVVVTCRALSVYEQDLVLEAAVKLSGGAEEGVLSLIPSIAQQLRVTMQVTRVNGVDQKAIYLDPKRGKAHDDQIDELIEVSDARTGRMPSSKFGFLVRAVNVFEHKVAKMHSLAYNKTFWKPVETD